MIDNLSSLARSAKRQGFRIERGARHWKFFAPNGTDIVVIGNSISDHRAFKNNMARLRRAGFKESA